MIQQYHIKLVNAEWLYWLLYSIHVELRTFSLSPLNIITYFYNPLAP